MPLWYTENTYFDRYRRIEMLYQITDGSVSLGGQLILSHIDFEIKGNERIAVVGPNGSGKTTLLRLIEGELALDRDDRRKSPGIMTSRQLVIGALHQQAFADGERTVEEELLKDCPWRDTFDRERFAYEQEYDRLFTGFGFGKKDKNRKLSSFSGGEQTKIALIRLLLQKPDILLLDEPTNHLDVSSCEWLEEYLRTYEHAVVMVSHDRFFLDRCAEIVYEIAGKKLIRYVGNYTEYRQEKQKRMRLQKKAYERQQQELERLNRVVERFKHKASKASFARAKKKQMDRLERVERPEEEELHLFTGEITPAVPGSKRVLEAEHLKLGYDKELLELSFGIRRGQKIGLIGPNGAGKTTFLKTAAGFLTPLGGSLTIGPQITIGYFDQHSAELQSEKTVLEHFRSLFPGMTEKEVRTVLGAYLFGGRKASEKVNSLSGGERARLVLAELLTSRPNFLILDEPTNHMDITAKETLESAFRAYTGTILFVSHDRYFIRQVAESVLIFEDHSADYYPFGYEHYLERVRRKQSGETIAAQITAEDQALIAGLKAVPKAERHRLREISTEDAYKDWKYRLFMERLEPVEVEYAAREMACREWLEKWQQSEEYWCTESAAQTEKSAEYEALCRRRDAAWEIWNALCLEWEEEWLEEFLF